MTFTIGIIGVGQIGASIGLGLKAKGATERILGHDRDRQTGRIAETMGAVDSMTNLRDSVKDSAIVFLCLPLCEMRGVLAEIGPILRENAIVIDTAPIKGQVMRWAADTIPAGRFHLGLVPTVNPALLTGTDFGVRAANAELFRRTIMMVVTQPNTPEEVEQLGMNIARLLGAKPMLIDPAEADGIMTTAHVVPQLASASLIEASLAAGGWAEARKLAGRPFSSVTGGMAYFDDPDSVAAAALSNPSRVVHGLDVLIAALHGLREDIAEHDEKSVDERLMQSYRSREKWLDDRNDAQWLSEGEEPVDLPGLGEHLTHLFFGGRIAEATKNLGEPRRDRK